MVIVLTLAALLVASPQAPSDTAQRGVTVAELLAEARRSSPLRAGAAAVSSGTRDAAALAGRRPNPLIDIRSENWTPGSGPGLPLDVWVLVTQPFELGGKREARLGIARAERDLAGASLAVIDVDITRRVTQLYLDALRSRGRLATLRANRDGLTTIIDALQRRVAAGTTAEADARRVETERARLDMDIARLALDLQRQLVALSLVVGRQAPLDPVQLVEIEVAAPSASLEVIAGRVLRRPDVAAADARIERAHQALSAERARRLPDPALTTGFKRTAGIGTVMAAITTTIPLFERNGSATARASGELVAARAERDALLTSLLSDARARVGAAQTLAGQAATSEAALIATATVVRDAARAAFREGTVDVLKLIDAERLHGDMQRAVLELRLDAAAAAIDARLALGEEPLP